MPELRKFIFHNDVLFITTSVEEGIMLPAHETTACIVSAAILRAQKHHPVTISHFMTSGTHIHMIVRVDNPADIPKFMERFKTESAHYINGTLGRKKRTIWCDSYDSPKLMGVDEVVEYATYLYTNPVKDRLTSTVAEYPGLSSYSLFNGTRKRMLARTITRDSVFPFPQDIGARGFRKVAKRLMNSVTSSKLQRLLVDPNDWMKAFGIEDPEAVNARIRTNIGLVEESQTEPCMGRERLENQGIDLTYVPERSGKKMWCIGRDKDKRKSYIKYLKKLAAQAEAVYAEWKRGNVHVPMPPGVFAPCMPLVANLLV